jgi:hypothetical protein
MCPLLLMIKNLLLPLIVATKTYQSPQNGGMSYVSGKPSTKISMTIQHTPIIG